MIKINDLVKLEGICNDDFLNEISNIGYSLLNHIKEECKYEDMYILSSIRRFLNESSIKDFIQSLVNENLCDSRNIALLSNMVNLIKSNKCSFDIQYLTSPENDIYDKMLILSSCMYFNEDNALLRIYNHMANKNNISYVILGEIYNQLLVSTENSNMLYASFCFSEDDYSYSDLFVDEVFRGISEIYSLGSNKEYAARDWYTQTFGSEYEEVLNLIEETIDIDWEKNFDNVFSDLNVIEVDGNFYAKYR